MSSCSECVYGKHCLGWRERHCFEFRPKDRKKEVRAPQVMLRSEAVPVLAHASG